MLVVSRYRVEPAGVTDFMVRARAAMAALSQREGFISGEAGQAIDEAGLMIMATRWRDVGSYRRALGSYDVKLSAVPLMLEAIDEASAFEVLHAASPDNAVDADSALAPDASTTWPGAPHG